MLRLNSNPNETLMAFKSSVVFMGGMNRPVLRNSTNEEIGARLRLTRLAYVGEDNASAFAREFGWTAQRYGNYEKGVTTMSPTILTTIADATGVTIQWLLRGETRGSDYDIMAKIKEIQEREGDPEAPRIPRTRGRPVKAQGSL